MTLSAAIVSHWKADATLGAISGPWDGLAPEGQAFPYCIMVLIGGPWKHQFGGGKLRPALVHFHLYHDSKPQAEACQALIHASFKSANLSSAGVRGILLRDDFISRVPGKSATAGDVFRATSIYEFFVQGD